jgi:hypothetical protein
MLFLLANVLSCLLNAVKSIWLKDYIYFASGICIGYLSYIESLSLVISFNGRFGFHQTLI